MIDKLTLNKATVCIIGLGYVGLPLATAFSRSLKVTGFDINAGKVEALNRGSRSQNLSFTGNPAEIGQADFIIICVPTPVTKSKEPDLSYVEASAATVSQNMKKNSVIILESTVYPGVTEEVVKPILESSGLKCGQDFKIGYSPERVNPGDTEHDIDKVTKVVAGMDKETTDLVAKLYRKVAPQVFKTRDIKTAEAAKVIENIQRDLNIALMNELAIIFEKMGLSTRDVLDAAATKWNFHRYLPGLVGGHCIPVDPYYLVHKSRELGYQPRVIPAGRAINDYMPEYIVEMTIEALKNVGKAVKGSRVLIMGLTYKEDVADTRENPVKVIIKKLEEYGVEAVGFDPLLDAREFYEEFNMRLLNNLEEVKEEKVDGIILAVAHSSFKELSLADLKEMQNNNPILIDVRGIFDATKARETGIYYKTL